MGVTPGGIKPMNTKELVYCYNWLTILCSLQDAALWKTHHDYEDTAKEQKVYDM